MKLSPGVNFINMLMWSFYARKYCCAKLLFCQQYYAQLYQCTKLEVTPISYTVYSTPCAIKIRVNPLAQKLLIECWWNWHLPSISLTFFARVFRTKVTFWRLFLVTRTYKNDVRTKNSRVLRWWNWHLINVRFKFAAKPNWHWGIVSVQHVSKVLKNNICIIVCL